MALSDNSGILTTMPVTPTGGMGGFGGYGGDGWWWIILLFLLWGNGGWGGNGQNGGVGSEVQRGFDHSATITKLDGLTTGICDATYALNNAITTGFHGVDSAICNLGYQTQQGFNQTNIALMQGQNALASQLASCCCDTQRQIERGFCDTQNTMNANTQAILGKLSQMEFNDLNSKYQAALSENQALKFQASQTAQNGFIDAVGNSIVARIQQPAPVPAYMVPNPNCCNTGCGC